MIHAESEIYYKGNDNLSCKDSRSPAGVLQVCLSYSWGGLEMSSVKWTQLFSQQGYPSYCLCWSGSKVEENLIARGQNAMAWSGRPYYSPSVTWKLRNFVRSHNIKTIYCHHLRDLWLITPALAFNSRIRLIGFARMFLSRAASKRDFLHFLVYSRINQMIALSEIQKKHLLSCLPLAEKKYVVIPNAVDTDLFNVRAPSDEIKKWIGHLDSATDAPESKNSKKLVVAVIGRIDLQKGQLEFVEAAHLLKPLHTHVQFVIIGNSSEEDLDYSVRLEQRIVELDLQKVVRVLPFVNNINEMMNAIDIFVLPSYEENFGNVLLEAMASGLGCVATASGGTPEILDNGSCGLLVPPRDPQSLAEAVKKLVLDPRLRSKLGSLARQRAVATYSMPIVFKKVAAVGETGLRPTL